MPELPDVELYKQYLDATSLHKKIEDVEVTTAKILGHVSSRRLQMRLKGHRFQSTKRHGKHLFVALDRPEWLMLHFGMTGRLQYFKRRQKADPHARMIVHFVNDYRLAYISARMLGRIELIRDVKEFVSKKKLGIDALDVSLDFEAFQQLLKNRRGTIKSALMNQAIVAGIGNVYSDGILFRAQIHPDTPVARLGREKLNLLFREMKRVLRTAIRCRVDADRFPRSYLLPHRDRDGQCPRCGRRLATKKVSGRTAYYCTNCQQKN